MDVACFKTISIQIHNVTEGGQWMPLDEVLIILEPRLTWTPLFQPRRWRTDWRLQNFVHEPSQLPLVWEESDYLPLSPAEL